MVLLKLDKHDSNLNHIIYTVFFKLESVVAVGKRKTSDVSISIWIPLKGHAPYLNKSSKVHLMPWCFIILSCTPTAWSSAWSSEIIEMETKPGVWSWRTPHNRRTGSWEASIQNPTIGKSKWRRADVLFDWWWIKKDILNRSSMSYWRLLNNY